jgi:hypothetical protein
LDIDQRHLTRGDGFEAALERCSDFARIFDFFTVASNARATIA